MVAFRRAAADDIPALHALVQSAYRGDASREGWTTEADLLGGQRTDPDALRAIIDGDGSRILVAEEHGVIVGCCQLERRSGGTAYLGMLAVAPGLQARGVGRAVVGEGERIARTEWGAERMQMTVIKQRSELIAWYQRLGYAPTGETAPFPYGDERFGVPKVADLEFVVLAKPLA
ncbi:MAG TPA: GNAT family N-acetyltransferase [Acidimicrobiales bacterium]|nr:GNAT family N-acetyltransferase [Acidimicrobiales bacterium]